MEGSYGVDSWEGGRPPCCGSVLRLIGTVSHSVVQILSVVLAGFLGEAAAQALGGKGSDLGDQGQGGREVLIAVESGHGVVPVGLVDGGGGPPHFFKIVDRGTGENPQKLKGS